MPGGDRTGPIGLGPRTGRGMGYCAGYPMPGYYSPAGWGMGGRGRGGGRGWRNQYNATGLMGWQRGSMIPPYGGGYGPAPPYFGVPAGSKQQLDRLQGQAEYLEEALKEIHQRIEELKAKDEPA